MSVFKKLGIKYPTNAEKASMLDVEYESFFSKFDDGKKSDNISYARKFH